ncbi:SMP-30/gluconolactonase/LRE family protein [Methylobacillus arboreus]|uniref:SMP-30/gluconolactonase/LRE family protein n=1 Tax=Methylobacillus arboreus TaxID=755170 RepID=UPI001E5A4CB4|nr:SMP-30/gluconolactonase/LRE family protein [Methylobacillus arboreus]MCB5191713.1 SMP-30/gluconolactonase/LRE family protein [Methylobacillus arboreus]
MHKTVVTALLGSLLMASGLAWAHDVKVVTGFKNPESVVVDKVGRVYVSEIGEFDKDGDGQISVIDADGKPKVFAKGLNDPKGLAFVGNDLYVADKDRILKIGKDGQWTVLVDKGAFPSLPKFLNDLEPDFAGDYLFVSDSGDIANQGGTSGAIYRITLATGKVSTVINHQQDARIKSPNGLWMDDTGEVLIYVDFASGILYKLDLLNRHLIELANGFGGGDGLALGANKKLYISDYVNGKVFSLSVEDEVKLEKQGFQSAADIGITPDGKTLLVPDMKAGTVTWVHLH